MVLVSVLDLIMNGSFSELLERLNWARTEIGAVAAEISKWSSRAVSMEGEPGEPGFIAVIAQISEPIPIGVRARSGTITNEIRSCLDALASEVALRNKVEGGAYFPFAQNEADFENDTRLRKRISRFNAKDRETLLGFRPFGIAKDGMPGNPLLYGLHHADIKRKHHRLIAKIAGARLSIVNGRVGEMRIQQGSVKIPGKTLVAQLSEDSEVELRFEPVLSYPEPDVLRGRPLIETLHDFANVGEAVVRAFL